MHSIFVWIWSQKGGLVTGALSILLSIAVKVAVAEIVRRSPAPRFVIDARTLAGEVLTASRGVVLTYLGKQTKRLTAVRIAFWNAGRLVIRREDVASRSPVRFRLAEGAEILSAKVLSADDANQVALTYDETTVTLTFEYLDTADGCIIQVVHNGTADHAIQADGRIHGTRLIPNQEAEDRLSRPLTRFMKPFDFNRAARLPWFARIPSQIALLVVTCALIPILIPISLCLAVGQGFVNRQEKRPQKFRDPWGAQIALDTVLDGVRAEDR